MSDAVAFQPGLADVPAAKSAVSFIDGQRARLEYRGLAVETLARESSYEETAWLLLKGELPTQRQLAEFDAALRARCRVKFKVLDMLKCMPEAGHPMAALQAGVAALGMFHPSAEVKDPATNWEAATRLIASVPTLVAAFHRIRQGDEPLRPRDDLAHAANFYWMLTEQEPTPAVAKVLDACLILHAEHEMNASTFTARVTGSTEATPYATISSAIGSLSGPLHGGANEEVLRMLEEISGDVSGWLQAHRAADPKYKVMGFGHRVYKVKDPRATVLQDLAERVFAESGTPPMYATAQELERVAEGVYGVKGVYPNVDFYSGIVYQSLGIPRDLFTPVFAIARVAGWLAHWLEQMRDNRIFRPNQIFVGRTDVAYVPLEKRP